MSRLKYFIFCLFMGVAFSVQSQSTDSIRFSLLTCAPGTEIYSLFGHTAIRYENYTRRIDVAFNYGMFSFNTPNFIFRFVAGETDYQLGITPYSYFEAEYAMRGSSVYQQVLNLTQSEKERLLTILENNYLPENRIYRYNYFYDNCTTRARDKIEECIEGKVVYPDSLSGKSYRSIVHEFTGVNYIDVYSEICKNEDCDIEFIFSNNPKEIFKYTRNVLACDIHTREKTKKALRDADILYGLDNIMNNSINGSGFNPKYGLLGSNKSTDEKLKLFPKDGEELVYNIQKRIKDETGKNVEVMIYGDGAFKDPVGKIWELADPVVSPFYTSGLEGTPNEIKLKYISDNVLSNLRGEELNNAMKDEIRKKEDNLVGQNKSLGTTPRRITDLVGSLCDLSLIHI